MKKIIHISQHNLRKNRKDGTNLKVITVRTYNSLKRTNHLEILDKNGNTVAKLVYSPKKPLSCGATIWLETNELVAFH